jgi:ecotropic viral integration site 5 protein
MIMITTTRGDISQYFQKELPGKVESDVEGLFNLAYSIKINQKKMKKMEKDYAELRKKEQEEMVELRVRKIESDFAMNLK